MACHQQTMILFKLLLQYSTKNYKNGNLWCITYASLFVFIGCAYVLSLAWEMLAMVRLIILRWNFKM